MEQMELDDSWTGCRSGIIDRIISITRQHAYYRLLIPLPCTECHEYVSLMSLLRGIAVQLSL